MNVETSANEPPRTAAAPEGSAETASLNGEQGRTGLLGMLSRFMFTPPDRPASDSAEQPQANLPKNMSHVSFASECFSDGNYFDYGDSGSDPGDDEPRTPPPPSMRRNGGSFGSFNSVSL
jgi:hypothetical protein